MKLQGTVIWVGQPLSGTSQRGTAWSKQDFVLRYNNAQYPNDICLTVFNQDKYIGKLQENMQVSVDFDCTVRDWTDKNGQVHKQNELTVWRDGIHSLNANGNSAPQQAQAPAPPAGSQPAQAPATGESDLPF